MNLLKKIILVLLFLFPISNSFGEIVTHVQTVTFDDGPYASAIEFNKDGTKMFVSHANIASVNLNKVF